MSIGDRYPLRCFSRIRRQVGLTLTFLSMALLIAGLATAGVLAAANPQIGPKPLALGDHRVPALVPLGIGRAPSISSLPLFRYMTSQAGRLKLTDQQYSALQSTYQQLQDELKPLITELQQAREELAKLWKESPVNEEAVLAATEKVTKLALEIRSKIAAAQEKIEASLTAEQKKELDTLKRQWQEKQKAQKQQWTRDKALSRGAWQDPERARKLMIELRERMQKQTGQRLPFVNPGWSAFIWVFPNFPGIPFVR